MTNVDMISTNFVVVDVIYSFVVGKFFYLKSFGVSNIHFKLTYSDIQIFDFFHMISDGDIPYAKVVVLDKIYSFVVKSFFFEII